MKEILTPAPPTLLFFKHEINLITPITSMSYVVFLLSMRMICNYLEKKKVRRE